MLIEASRGGACAIERASPARRSNDIAAMAELVAKRACDLVAVDIGQADVEHHEIGLELACRRQCVGASLHCVRLLAEQTQQQ